jgi:Mg/Co/Ni transporter MgtE
MDTNSDGNFSSTKAKTIGTGALTGAAVAGLVMAGVVTFLTGGLAAVPIAAGVGALAGGMAGDIYSGINGSSS